MDSDSEDEIFFGPVSSREEHIAAPFRNRKTEIFIPGMSYLYRRSLVPMLASLEEEEGKANNGITTSQPLCAQDLIVPVDIEEPDMKKLSFKEYVADNRNIRKTDVKDELVSPICIDLEAVTTETSNVSCVIKEDVFLSSCKDVRSTEKSFQTFEQKEEELPLTTIEVGDALVSKRRDFMGSEAITEVITDSLNSEGSEVITDSLDSEGSDFMKSEAISEVTDSRSSGRSDPMESEAISEVTDALNCGRSDLMESGAISKVTDSLNSGRGDLMEGGAISEVTDSLNFGRSDLMESGAISEVTDTLNSGKSDPMESEAISEVTDALNCGRSDLMESGAISEVTDSLNSGKSEAISEVTDALNSGKSDPMESEAISEVTDALNCGRSDLMESGAIGEVTDSLNSGKSDPMESEAISEVTDALNSGRSDLMEGGAISEVTDSLNCGRSDLMESGAISEVTDTLNSGKSDHMKNEGSTSLQGGDFGSFSLGKNNEVSCSLMQGALLQCSEGDISSQNDSDVNNAVFCSSSKVDYTTQLSCNGNDKDIALEESDKDDICGDVLVNSEITECKENESDALICDSEQTSLSVSVEDQHSVSMSASPLLEVPSSADSDQVDTDSSSMKLQSSSEPQNHCDLYANQIDSSAESYGIINRGLILSQTPNLDSCSFSSGSFDCSTQPPKAQTADSEISSLPSINSSDHPRSPTTCTLKLHNQDRSPLEVISVAGNESETHRSSVSKHSPVKSANFEESVNSDESLNESDSPARRFNDTIEEMEMLLKYGLNYGEDTKEVEIVECGTELVTNTLPKENYDRESEDKHDDSIISPRKSSVMSSVSNFDPEFNSTRVPFWKEQIPGCDSGRFSETPERRMSNVQLIPQSPAKAVPPPKPPRHVNFISESPDTTPGKTPVKTSTPRDRLHLQSTPKMSKVQTPLRKDPGPVLKHSAISRSTPRAPPVSRTKSNMVTPISDSKRLPRIPHTVTGVTRSTPLKNTLRERELQPSTPGTFSSTASKLKNRYLPSSRKLTPIISQRTRSVFIQKHSDRDGLPPHPAPSKRAEKPPVRQTPRLLNRDKGTPQHLMIKKHVWQGGLNIVSPVAKYLKENPPPPLVVNVKPRHRIQSDVEKASFKSDAQPSPETGKFKVKRSKHTSSNSPVLPVAMYSSAVAVVVDGIDDKENDRIRHRQEIASTAQQPYVMKHKGRVKVPKGTVKEEMIESSSPKGYNRSPSNFKPTGIPEHLKSSLRGSLMEVSLYEPLKTQYSNTLK